MLTLFRNSKQIVTVDTGGRNFKRGSEMKNVSVLEDYSLIVEDGIIKDIVPNCNAQKGSYDKIIDAKDMVITPGLIDCHTHTVFAGSRANEFKMKLEGKTYEEISNAGGGIANTANAIRETTIHELETLALKRINHFKEQGITTLEIKSGYGLDFENEVKILSVVKEIQAKTKVELIPTFLGAHTFPKEYKENREGYIQQIIKEMIPYIAKERLAVFCDAFCEKTAFSPEEVDKIFETAREYGFLIKIHTDQFNSIGGVEVGLRHQAVSIDHLEVIEDDDIGKLADSESVSVLLPGVSFYLNYDFAPARKLIELGSIVAISSDYNPGSSHISNLHFIMSLAAMRMKMTFEEILAAVTINAAKALGISNRVGSIEIGKAADLAIFQTTNYADIFYSIGTNLLYQTVKNGEIIYQKTE